MVSGGGADGIDRISRLQQGVARQTERRALADGRGRQSLHGGKGPKRRFRRFLRRLRHGTPDYRCTCDAASSDGKERHSMACILANESDSK